MSAHLHFAHAIDPVVAGRSSMLGWSKEKLVADLVTHGISSFHTSRPHSKSWETHQKAKQKWIGKQVNGIKGPDTTDAEELQIVDNMVRCSDCQNGSANGTIFLHCGKRLPGVELPQSETIEKRVWQSAKSVIDMDTL